MVGPVHTFASVVGELVAGLEAGTIAMSDENRRFTVVVDGVDTGNLQKTWSELCTTGAVPAGSDFKAVYPHLTKIQGNRFQFRGGDPDAMRDHLEHLLQDMTQNTGLTARVEPEAADATNGQAYSV
jgi:hypothetical protein